ncbi:hypothetical protein F4680DRAFT_432406 [Xylaria scruposa]|nr:hypothetical protein F4680DRAFT_432406 [Xylaria scruposa]
MRTSEHKTPRHYRDYLECYLVVLYKSVPSVLLKYSSLFYHTHTRTHTRTHTHTHTYIHIYTHTHQDIWANTSFPGYNMRVTSSFAIIALSCAVQGLAIDHVARNGRETHYGLGTTKYSGDNFCGHTSFHEKISSQSLVLADCYKVLDYYNAGRTTGYQLIGWDKDHLQSNYVELENESTCAFAVKPVTATDNLNAAVMTWGDIADLVQTAIHKYGDKGLRSGGRITCQVPDSDLNRKVLGGKGPWQKVEFEWEIYRPGDVPVIQW